MGKEGDKKPTESKNESCDEAKLPRHSEPPKKCCFGGNNHVVHRVPSSFAGTTRSPGQPKCCGVLAALAS
jgi:hypothetical protein